MPVAPQPRMHGITHVPGGPDPIPGMPSASTGASLEYAYLTPGGLEAWWRLGEDAATFPTTATPTTGWAQDSSGHGRHLTAYNRNHTGSGPQLAAGNPSLPSSVTGAYPAGSDDGGLRFNYAYDDTLANGGQVGLKAGATAGGGFNTDFFVEGIHYTARPGPPAYPIVELTLDVSPSSYYPPGSP